MIKLVYLNTVIYLNIQVIKFIIGAEFTSIL